MADDTTVVAPPPPAPAPPVPTEESARDNAIINQALASAGLMPKPTQPALPPLGANIPDWDQIRGTDTFQQSNDQDRTAMLGNWAALKRQEIDQTAQSEGERALANKHLDETLDRESVTSLERYGMPENIFRDVVHSGITGATRLARETVGAIAPAAKAIGITPPGVDITKPFRKAEKWAEKNALPPDQAWEVEHPGWHAFASSIGGVAPFIVASAGAELATGGAATPFLGAEAAGAIGIGARYAADTALQSIDMYQSKYESSLAKIDNRIKHGENISDADREYMARDDASRSLWGMPFMVASNMMISRLVGHGMDIDAAKGFWDQFTKNVLLRRGGEFVGQVGLGTGLSAIDALADQYSGVDRTGITPEKLKAGAAMGAGFGVTGLTFGTLGFGRQWRATQGAVNSMTDGVQQRAEALMKGDTGLANKDAREQAIRDLVPARHQDAVRAKLAQRDAAKTLSDASTTDPKSPQLNTELAKQADETEKEATTPTAPAVPAVPAPAEPIAEVPKPSIRQYGKQPNRRVINKMLDNGHITPDQHTQLITEVNADPDNPAAGLDTLAKMVQASPARPQGLAVTEPTIFDLRKLAGKAGPGKAPSAVEQEEAKLPVEQQNVREQARQDAEDQAAIEAEQKEAAAAGLYKPETEEAELARETKAVTPPEKPAEVPPAERPAERPAEAAAPAVPPEAGAPPVPPPPAVPPGAPGGGPPADPFTALKAKTEQYVGDATKAERKEVANNFVKTVLPEGIRPQLIAGQLMHRLGLDVKQQEHPAWQDNPAQAKLDMIGRFNQYLDQLTGEEGTLAAKPRLPAGPIAHEDFFRMVDQDANPQELHDRLTSGQTLALPEAVATSEKIDAWLLKNKFGEHVDPATGLYIVEPIKDKPGAFQAALAQFEALKEKKPAGRPLGQEWIPSQLKQPYLDQTDKLLEHPAEKELMDEAMETRAIKLAEQSGSQGQLIASGAASAYLRQLRLHAAKWRAAHREGDFQLHVDLAKLKAQLRNDPENTALKDAIKDKEAQIEAAGPLRDENGKIVKPLQMVRIISSITKDYLKHKKRVEDITAGPPVSYTEGFPEEEGVSPQMMEAEIVREKPEEERILEEVERALAEGFEPVSSEEEEKWAAIGSADHEAEATEFAKTLRSNREKQALWYIVGHITDGEVKPPEGVAKLPKTFKGKNELLNLITNEYLRFLAQREPGRAVPGGEERGAPAAAAPRGAGIPPGPPPEVPGGAGGPRPGETGDNAATIQSSAHPTRDQGAVASGEPSPTGPRESVAGVPEPTTESSGIAPGTEAQLLPTAPGAAERVTGGGAPGAGRIGRDAATGERIVITPEGAERGRRRTPILTPEDEERFQNRIKPQINRTANGIWKEWEETGKSDKGQLLGLSKTDFPDKAALVKGLNELVNGLVKQDPTLEGRERIARDALMGLPPLKGEMSASQIRRAKTYASQTKPITTGAQLRRIVEQSWNKFSNGFGLTGATRKMDYTSDRPDHIAPLPDGKLVYIHSPKFWDKLSKIPGMTEGHARSLAESMLEQELIHGAHLGMYRDQWNAEGRPTANFKAYAMQKSAELVDSFLESKAAAQARGDDQMVRALDKTIASSVKSYWGEQADGVNSYNDFVNWISSRPEAEQDEISFQMPFELARQLTQLDVFGRTTEQADRTLLGKLHDWFMAPLRYLRRMALRVREGALGPVWKDTITTLEKNVRDIRAKMEGSKPDATAAAQMHQESLDLASKLSQHFMDRPGAARAYGMDFRDAVNAPEFANKIIQKLQARPGATPELVHQALHAMALREGLIDPPQTPGQALYMGKMASLAPGIGASHVLDEGDSSRLPRFFRHSTDPEMRDYAKSLTLHRDKLLGVNIRELKHPVPAAFYHNGDIWVTEAALNHPAGQKAVANELQHAIAQEIITHPKSGEDHEAGAHALALTDEFKRSLPANIRDAVDNKFPDVFTRLKTDGIINWDHVNDEEREWFPLIQAASHPTEFVKKTFSSANFRDYLRSLKSDRGDPLWDNVHDWGRTLFGDQAFKYAPESNEIAYNRPGAVLQRVPEVKRGGELELLRNDARATADALAEQYQTGKLSKELYLPQIRKIYTDRLQPMLDAHEIHPDDVPFYEARNAVDAYEHNYIGVRDFRAWAEPGAMDRLEQLFDFGHINEEEYDRRVQLLLDDRLMPEDLKPTVVPLTREELAKQAIKQVFTQQRFQKYSLDKSPPEILDKIALHSESSAFKRLAAHYADILRKNPGLKINLDDALGNAGSYSLEGDKLNISPIGGKTDSEFEQLMLHEMTHAITSGKISAYLTGRFDLLSRKEFNAIQELEQLRRLAIQHKDTPQDIRDVADIPGYVYRSQAFNLLAGFKEHLDDYYGTIDLHEFVSEALTNANFQKVLDNIPFQTGTTYKRETVLGRLFNWLSNFLGFKQGYGMDAALRNIAKLIRNEQRVMHADFKLEDTTGDPTGKMQRQRMAVRFLELKAKMEGYAKAADVPRDILNFWYKDWKGEYAFSNRPDPTKPQIIDAPIKRGFVQPSDELNKKTDPEDILDHMARVSGVPHHDGIGLAKVADRAYLDGALSGDQYLSLGNVLKEINYANLNWLPINLGGKKTDPNSPERVLDRWGHMILPEGQMPKEMHRVQLEKLIYERAAVSRKLTRWVQQLNTLVRKHMGVDPLFIPQRNNELMNDALAGRPAPGVHPEILNHLKEGRALIDDFSDKLLASGFLKPDTDLYNEFIGNRGQYVARMYRIFTDPRFQPTRYEVGGVRQTLDQMRAAAIPAYKTHYINKQIHEAGDAAARWYRPGTEAYNKARESAEKAAEIRLAMTFTDGMAEHELDKLLAGYRQIAEAKNKGKVMFGPAFVLNDSLLQELTKLPKAVRAMMGEELDVRKNLVNTIMRQSNYLQSISLAHQWKLEGGGKYFGDDYDPAKNWTHQIHSGAVHLGELAGKYTSKEIHDVLMGYASLATNLPDVLPGLHALEGAARYMTTILSARRGIGNIWSSSFQMLQNGMLDPRDIPTSARAMKDYLVNFMFRGTNEQHQARIEDAIRYGVIDKAVDIYTMRNMIDSGFKHMQRGPLDYLEGIDEYVNNNRIMARIGLKGSWRKEAAEWIQKFHTMGNDINKMAQWYAKQKFVRDADLEDVRMAKLRGIDQAPMTEDEIKREAARIVNDTNISYSLASPLAKMVRRYPIIAPFVTFWNEQARSYLTQWGYALNYIRSPNSVRRTEGLKRLAGIIASASFAGVLMQTAMRMFGISPRQDQNNRKMLPPWEQNKVRIYLAPMANGRLTYMNLDYVMPQGDLARAVIAALTPNQDGIGGRAMDAVKEYFNPFFNLGLMPGALADTIRNQTEYGTQVYNPQDHFLKFYGLTHPEGKAWDVLNYLGTRFTGGTLGRGGRQLPQLGTVTRGGVVYDPNILLGSEIGGLDLHEISIPDRFRARLFSSHDELNNAQKIFTGPIQRNVLTDTDMRAAYQHMEDVRRITFGRLHDMVESARNSGMTTGSIRSAFKERRYPSQLINDLLSGHYHPYIPGKGILQEARKVGNHMPTGLFSHAARNYEEEEQ